MGMKRTKELLKVAQTNSQSVSDSKNIFLQSITAIGRQSRDRAIRMSSCFLFTLASSTGPQNTLCLFCVYRDCGVSEICRCKSYSGADGDTDRFCTLRFQFKRKKLHTVPRWLQWGVFLLQRAGYLFLESCSSY